MERLISKFLANPCYLTNGSGSLSRKWNCTREEIIEARAEAKKRLKKDNKAETANYISALEEEIFKKINNEKGTLESTTTTTFEPKSDLELATLHKIDLTKYKISNYWTKLKSNGKFTSSVFCTSIKESSPEKFQEGFTDFLKTFTPSPVVIKHTYVPKKPKVALVLPKQDAHFNKLDIYGNNDINKRFSIVQTAMLNMLLTTTATNFLEETIYIVGSDQFNSEWTSLTTKGTPQQNILSYQAAFTEICNHEVEIITTLLYYSDKVKVVFIPGNHDEFVGWHLINWLESYFRDNKDISFNSSTENTKYFRYNNSAIMLNHGDDMKPKDLSAKFPMGFKTEWSLCDNFYIFTGDRHHELSLDIAGIKFYQIPQLSSAKSKWDDKKGFESRAEMTAFILTEDNGMSHILKEML